MAHRVSPLVPTGVLGEHSGAVAQLGEHRLCKPGVTGSNPVSSTGWLARVGRTDASLTTEYEKQFFLFVVARDGRSSGESLLRRTLASIRRYVP